MTKLSTILNIVKVVKNCKNCQVDNVNKKFNIVNNKNVNLIKMFLFQWLVISSNPWLVLCSKIKRIELFWQSWKVKLLTFGGRSGRRSLRRSLLRSRNVQVFTISDNSVSVTSRHVFVQGKGGSRSIKISLFWSVKVGVIPNFDFKFN